MVISILHFFIDLPDTQSLKDKRHIVKSAKDRLQAKFKCTVAEGGFQDSLRSAEMGVAVLSNSRQFGESVMNKALNYIEKTITGRIRDAEIFSDRY